MLLAIMMGLWKCEYPIIYNSSQTSVRDGITQRVCVRAFYPGGSVAAECCTGVGGGKSSTHFWLLRGLTGIAV